MLFNSFEYLIFLPLVLAFYWFAPPRFRLLILLVASYVFYMSWRVEYGLLLFGLSLFNFIAGFLVSQSVKAPAVRRICFVAALAANLATLALFKYTNFFIDSSWSLLSLFGSMTHYPIVSKTAPAALPIILPLGISFFVFEFIHYLVDVYKGQNPIKNPLRFGLFAAFFPSQIAGPIKRFEDFDEQAGREKKFDPQLFQTGILLIIQGMFKKVAIGDNLAPLVSTGFAHCHQINGLDAWTAVVAFTLQIYYDFSGYTDIGRGSANLLGYRLPENFQMPYISKSVAEFWHRWHISLSTWLRDYLYIPLGGSRHGKVQQMRNLLITMLLGGLWHGASWTFVLWGAYQGMGLVICHSWEAFARRFPIFQNSSLQIVWDNISRALTLTFVMFGWVLFRAENMDQFQTVCASMLGFAGLAHSPYDLQVCRMFVESPLPLAFSLYVMFNACTYAAGKLNQSKQAANWNQFAWWLNPPLSARVVAVAGATCLILGLAPRSAVPFIYFQF